MTPLTSKERAQRAQIIDETYRRNPGRGYLAAIQEGAGRFSALRSGTADPLRTQAAGKAPKTTSRAKGKTMKAKTAKAARKAAGRAAEAAVIARVVTETLTAAQAPKPAPGTGLAPAAGSPGTAAPDRPLHELSSEEFADWHAAELGAYGEATGLRSPFWRGAAAGAGV